MVYQQSTVVGFPSQHPLEQGRHTAAQGSVGPAKHLVGKVQFAITQHLNVKVVSVFFAIYKVAVIS